MVPFLKRQWFLLSLFALICLGFCFPSWFDGFSQAKTLRNWIVASVLFAMALPLDTRAVGASIRRPWPALVASVLNIGILPLVAWLLTRLLSDDDMQRGLMVTAAVPCTLASAAVWTRRAGGDDTVAILVTLITNLTCFLTIPFWLYVSIGSELNSEDLARLARMPIRLGLLVVLPMTLAQLLRQAKPIGDWATQRRRLLSIFSQLGILAMVLAGATICGQHMVEVNGDRFSGIFAVAVLALTLHLTLLFLGHWIGGKLGFDRPQRIAIGFAGSQKTLMVGLEIAITYVGGLGILPMVIYHVGQLLTDTVIADRLRSRNT